ncbi:MAG: peptidoglycan-associated lipoprotein Pal [Deltaproteobacteria bacterium]
MTRKRTSYLTVFLAALAIIVAGCAGVEKTEEIASTAPPAAQTTKQDSVEQAKDVEIIPPDTTQPSVSDTSDTTGHPASESIKQEDIKAERAQSEQREAALSQKALTSAPLQVIYFDYDKYIIRDSEKDSLARNAKWLSENKTAKVRIEGHADERGEEDYNLALGDKRARGVKNYLQSMGINQERLSTLSYGEERPAVEGHGEDAWAKNRRVEFKLMN